MAWTKLDDAFLEDETILSLSHPAYRLYVSGLVYSSRNLTDGVITDRAVKVLQAILQFNVKRQVVELVEAGLWLLKPDGSYEVKSYLKYNQSAAKVKETRARNAERQARHRERSNDEGNALHNAVSNAVSNVAPSRPDPESTSSPPNGSHYEGGHIDESLRKLALATGVRTTQDVDKLTRTVRSRCSSESDIAGAIEACTGPGVRDRLAVALAELVKRSNDRRSTAA